MENATTLVPDFLPQHLGIIMDGNGRWAKKRGLPRPAGHKEGAANFKRITRYCSSIGIKYLTVYAFSTENWSRPAAEVSALMVLFRQYLEESLRDFLNDDIKVRFIGDTSVFPTNLQRLIAQTWEVSKKMCIRDRISTGLQFGCAFSCKASARGKCLRDRAHLSCNRESAEGRGWLLRHARIFPRGGKIPL